MTSQGNSLFFLVLRSFQIEPSKGIEYNQVLGELFTSKKKEIAPMLTNTNLFLELCLIHSFDHLPSFEKKKNFGNIFLQHLLFSLQKKSVIFILIVTTTNRVSSFAETYNLIAHWKLDGTDNDISYDVSLIPNYKLPQNSENKPFHV